MLRVVWLGAALIAAGLAYAQNEPATPAGGAASATAAPAGENAGGDHAAADAGLKAWEASVQAGAAKTAACTACHGPNGNSTNPQWPSLAGQNASYIAEQLKLFKSGARPNPVMMPMASTLSDADITDVSNYYSAQTPTGREADPSYWKAGQGLYMAGDAAHGVPACFACHGPVGRGNPAAGYPALRAQFAEYTVKQLTDYQSGARYKPDAKGAPPSRNGVMMYTIAKRLNPEEIRNVASFIQGMR